MKAGTRIPLVAATVVVLALVGATFFLRNSVTVPAESSGVVDTRATPARGPDAAASDVAVRSAGPVARVDRGSLRDQAISHTERRAEMRQEHARRSRELKARSAARYASERADPDWAPAKERELTTLAANKAFDQADARPSSLSVDCRTSMCRLDGQFATSGQAEDWVMMYMATVGDAMPNSVVSRSQSEDGSTRIEIYGRAR